MKHLTISEYGSYLGVEASQLVVREKTLKRHFPLNRLCTVSVAKRGVGISSDLIEAFSRRGIKLFFLDFRGVAHSALIGQSQHGVVAVRQAQQTFCQSGDINLASRIVQGKIRNQRAVLNHLNKYHQHTALPEAGKSLLLNANKAQQCADLDILLGLEGASANVYFQALKGARLFSSSFAGREGRGSTEINNAMLNLGYAVLSGYILNAIINAGLEPYLGVLHSKRPGEMALVLDLMEEYRAWVVDRTVVKLRQQSEGKKALDSVLKKNLIAEIQGTCRRKYPYRKKKLKLEHIMQRQVYRLCGHFYGDKFYKPYLFKW